MTEDSVKRTRHGFAVSRPPSIAEPIAPMLAEGARIHQYELIRELGRGGMGMVWSARDTKLGRRVAIKFLLDATREVAERFLTEARATAQCNHDNIVIIHQVDEQDGVPYMVLELLDGHTLREVMGGVQLPASRAVELALPIARALARAHELGIVHRDLKPENVFVTGAGQVKVLDFGIAKALGSEDARPRELADARAALGLTREGTMVGTLPYMSPEQMMGSDVDHRTDLWALGIILFEMLAGRHPIEPLTTDVLISTMLSDDPMPSIRSVVPDVPEALAALVDGCLRKPRGDRIARAIDLVRALEGLLPGRHGRRLGDDESPYPGLTAFQEGDADRFFGRGREVVRAVARVRELPLVGIVGASGVGKSSFMRAGVGPALKASGERWEVVTLRPGRQPLAALASVALRVTTRSGPGADARLDEHAAVVARIRAEPGYVGTLLRARARQTGGQILVFVDQLEELYTLVADAGERQAFTAALTAIADDSAAPLRVAVSMRSDLLDRIAEDAHFMAELARGLVFLSAPDRGGLREALTAPLDLVGYRFESSAMVEDMLDALEGVPGALPLLQFAAARLWDARDRGRAELTVSSYNAIGGLTGALATHADDVVAQMNPAAQKLAQRIFRQLVTPERTRAIVELSDLHALSPDRDEMSRLVGHLVDARLLVVQTRGETGGGTVELVHESLIERWPTLRRWLDEDQEDAAFLAQLAAAAKQWDAKRRPAGLLWRGDAMEEARRWHAQRPRELPARERAYLDAVLALERRGRRARRVALVLAFVVLGAIAAGASIALVWIRGAEQEASDSATRANDALAQMKQKEAERAAAEQRKADAERQKAAADAQRVAAEASERNAQEKVEQQSAEIADSKEQLAAKNQKLEVALREASVAKERAEREKANAQRAADELAQENADLRRRNEELEQEKKKLATKLK
jgi:tRNA A-37 threonylcarbamoyl transferase component Bud32